MHAFVLIVKLLSFTNIMSVTTITILRSLTIRFEKYQKSPYVSMREHLSYMSNIVSEMDEMGYELTNK